MAHFAQLDDNNVVINVIVVNDSDTTDDNGVETESVGIAFCQNLLGKDTNWRKTSYNNNIRGNYAGIGMIYMENVATLGVGSTDIFIGQQPYDSWTIDPEVARWVSPAGDEPILTHDQIMGGFYYIWDESTYQWRLVTRD